MQKKVWGVFLAGIMTCLAASSQVIAGSGIAIDAATFPDANFREALSKMEIGSDGVLTDAEIDKLTALSVSDQEISDLTGVEVFTSLERLYCERNQLKKLPKLPQSLGTLVS